MKRNVCQCLPFLPDEYFGSSCAPYDPSENDVGGGTLLPRIHPAEVGLLEHHSYPHHF